MASDVGLAVEALALRTLSAICKGFIADTSAMATANEEAQMRNSIHASRRLLCVVISSRRASADPMTGKLACANPTCPEASRSSLGQMIAGSGHFAFRQASESIGLPRSRRDLRSAGFVGGAASPQLRRVPEGHPLGLPAPERSLRPNGTRRHSFGDLR